MQKQLLTSKERQKINNFIKFIDHFGPILDNTHNDAITDRAVEMLNDPDLRLIDLGTDYMVDGEWKACRQYAERALEGDFKRFLSHEVAEPDTTIFDCVEYDEDGDLVIS